MLSRRPERGSIALVVMVVFVMAGLATVMVSRVVSDSRVVIGDSDRAVALDASDVGLAEVRARIVSGETAAFDSEGEAGAARWWATATPADSKNWTIEVTGTSHRVSKLVRAALAVDAAGVWRQSNWYEVLTRVEPVAG